MVDERLDGRIVQVGVGGVDGVPGVGAHTGRTGQEGLKAVTADAQHPGQAPQQRLEEGAARPGARVRADLLVVEGDQDDGLGGWVPAAASASRATSPAWTEERLSRREEARNSPSRPKRAGAWVG